MPISCSLEMPNSAARSWIRVVTTNSSLSTIGYWLLGRALAPYLSHQPPVLVVVRARCPARPPPAPAARGFFVHPRAAPLSRSCVGRHPAPAPRTPTFLAAIPP